MRTITLRELGQIPVLGQGTWYLGDDPSREKAEMEALRTGIDLGMTLIDSAEMYGNGRSERLVGKAIRTLDRDKLQLVSKVLPSNAGRRSLKRSAEQSMRNMGTDYLDLYLLHWRGSIPLYETVEEMESLVRAGRIRAWGVSNLDTDDMQELLSLKDGTHCVVDQVLFHLGSRGAEYDLLPYLLSRDIALMAYCPLAQAGSLRQSLLSSPDVQSVARKHGATVLQILLAFVISRKGVFAIPRTGNAQHTRENAAAADIVLDAEDLKALDGAFPKPDHKTWLDIV